MDKTQTLIILLTVALLLFLLLLTLIGIIKKQLTQPKQTACNTLPKSCKKCICKSCTNQKLCGFPNTTCQLYSKEV